MQQSVTEEPVRNNRLRRSGQCEVCVLPTYEMWAQRESDGKTQSTVTDGGEWLC